MKNRKNWLVRIVAVLMVLLLALGGIVATIASAEGEMDIQAAVSPDALSGPEEVTLSITLANDSAYKMEDIVVSGNGLSREIAELAQGSVSQIDVPYMVNEYELDDGISISVRWRENGQALSETRTISIKQKKTNPKIVLKRSISKTSGQPGEEIVLTYTIQNTGDVDLERITVTDKGVSNAPIWEDGKLRAGDDAKTIEKKVLLTTEAVETHPSVEATSKDGKTVDDAVSKKVITSIAPKIALNAVAKEPTEEGVPILVTIKNEGNTPVEQITVRDDVDVILADGLALQEGESKEYTHIVSDAQARSVVITFTGKVKGESEPLSLASEPIAIEPKAILATEAETEAVAVDVSVIPATSTMEQAGELSLKIILNNKGTVPLQNVSISEEVRGKLKNIPVLPPGQMELDDVKVSVLTNDHLKFEIFAYDAYGERYDFDVTPVSITVYTPAVSLSETPAALEETQDKETGSFMWLIVLLVLIVLLLVLLVGLVTVFIKERKLKRKIEMGEEEQDVLAQYDDDAEDLPKKSRQTVKRNLQYDDELDILHEPSPPQRAKRSAPVATPPVQSSANAQKKKMRSRDGQPKKIVMKNPHTRILNIEMGEEPEAYREKEFARKDDITLPPMQSRSARPRSGHAEEEDMRPQPRPAQSRPTRREEDAEPVRPIPLRQNHLEAEEGEPVVRPTPSRPAPAPPAPEEETLETLDDEELFAYTFLGEKPDRRSETEKLFDDEFLE